MTTREELFLRRINDISVEVPLPVTRKEKLLYELAGVNGLGIELPMVSSADDGKVLTVTNGLWGISGDGGSERTLIYEGTIQPMGAGIQQVSITPLTSNVVWDAVRVTYDGKEYVIPRAGDVPMYGEYDDNLHNYVFTTYPVGIEFYDTTTGAISIGDAEREHQIKIEGEGSCEPIPSLRLRRLQKA